MDWTRKTTFLFLFTCVFVNMSVNGQISSNLPIVEISTTNDITDENKIDGYLTIYNSLIQDTNYITDTPSHHVSMGIELRGRSSLANNPKKGFGFEIRDVEGKDSCISIFGWPKESDFVIHSPYADKSLMRNVLAYDLAGELFSYAPRTKLVEMWVNKQYYGVCVITEKIKTSKGRVDIEKPGYGNSKFDTTTGGYIFKFDKGDEDEVVWKSKKPNNSSQRFYQSILIHDPKPSKLSAEQKEYISSYFDLLDEIMVSPDFMDEDVGYRQYFDINSIIDFMIINEITHDVDAYRISTYFYKVKDSKGGKLFMGPVWDYNIAFGNANFCDGQNVEGWAWDFNLVCKKDQRNVHFWWKRWLIDPYFIDLFKTRWETLRNGTLSNETIVRKIDSLEYMLRRPQARNFETWPVIGEWVWPNYFVGNSYQQEVEYLKKWLLQRLVWMDKNIMKKNFNHQSEPELFHYNVFPNPSSTEFKFSIELNKPDQSVRIRIIDMHGQIVHSSPLLSGPSNVVKYSWNHMGKVGVYVAQIMLDGRQITSTKLVGLGI